MSEDKVTVALPILIPGAASEDVRVSRLEETLAGHRQVIKVHLKKDSTPAEVCLHYDAASLSQQEALALARRAGDQVCQRYHAARLALDGMDCSDCALVIEHSLPRMKGVLSASVNFTGNTLDVAYDTRETNRRAIERRLEALGYTVALEGPRAWLAENSEMLLLGLSGLLMAGAWIGETWLGLPGWAALLVFLLSMGIGGQEVAHHAWHAVRERRFDSDGLMLLAAVGAVILGEAAEGALLVFLFSLGHALEERAMGRARNAIRGLAALSPRTAWVRDANGDGWVETAVERLSIGDVILVRPGTRVPADGEVASGVSAVDQSPITGESLPVEKQAGSPVFAGTVNGEGALEVKVSRLNNDSTLARVIRLVEEAQSEKSPTQQIMEKFERRFVPTALAATVLTAALGPVFGLSWNESILRALSLLVASSPCALALGAPASALAGLARAARGGVLVKGGAQLEQLGEVKAVVFDKTGTLTFGKPEVTQVIGFGPGLDENAVLALAAGMEQGSAHPLAQAIVRAAQARRTPLTEVEGLQSTAGRGLTARVGGRAALAGSPVWMEENGVSVSAAARAAISGAQERGQTTVLAALDGELVGMIALADTLRPETPNALAALRRQGVKHLAMLSGDNWQAARAIAGQAGLDAFEADLMPEDKAGAVSKLVVQWGSVAMVGDGVNDAPALARASVGVAMGGAGTDVALETAGVALMGDRLERLAFAVGLGRATRRVTAQNLTLALGVIAVLSLAAVLGWTSIGGAVFFHEGSTVLVILNALRLLNYSEA